MADEHRGFGSMDPVKRREIAVKGGRAAHTRGTAHQWTSEEAQAAGRKGGRATQHSRRARIAKREQDTQSNAAPSDTSGALLTGRQRPDVLSMDRSCTADAGGSRGAADDGRRSTTNKQVPCVDTSGLVLGVTPGAEPADEPKE